MNRALGIDQTPIETPVRKWFINEDGGTYPYDPATQAEAFPADDHTPYDTETEAIRVAEAGDLPLFKVEVLVEIRATDEEAAYAEVDAIMQRSWNRERDEYDSRPWHFEMYDDCVRRVSPLEEG